jgi:hypothetical protein
MRCLWRELLLSGAALGSGHPLAAQRGWEAGVQAIGTFSEPALAVAGAFGALRTSARTRIAAFVGAGVSDERIAWRGELLGHFLFSPDKQRGSAFYLAGGIAGVEGPASRGYLTLLLGLEDRPGGTSGWAVEAGVGGGFRVALAYRWRMRSGGGPG